MMIVSSFIAVCFQEELEHQKSLLTGGTIPDNADPELVERYALATYVIFM